MSLATVVVYVAIACIQQVITTDPVTESGYELTRSYRFAPSCDPDGASWS
jgi:hypothetical protein